MGNDLLFALDIGTRSVVGLVGERIGNAIKIRTWCRQEHRTRAMLDGQIHNVPEVAAVLGAVKAQLEETCGPLRRVSVAAAGRALCTIEATAQLDGAIRGFLTADDERALELAAIQEAQKSLAGGGAVPDPGDYYCVGFSVVSYTLDGTVLKSLVGQRGKSASVDIIATFLPRQVIDSLHAAISAVGLEVGNLTLEPIAAINVLIPPTMRHLNLALVDVGAGTSDVAITRDGSVIGYGMVPCAGDEITEAISQRFLLDFNVAEDLKRRIGSRSLKARRHTVTDVLGQSRKLTSQEVIDSIAANVAELAQAIAAQILALNRTPPQAVLLVGGGSLTPCLPQALAQALDVPDDRVAIRRPETVPGIAAVPPELQAPDAVTPLGILRLAGSSSLNFINISFNGEPLRLFNFGRLTIADALLSAGVDPRTLHGRPGLGLTVKVNQETRFIAGSLGEPGVVRRNGNEAALDDPLAEGDAVTVVKGADGAPPTVRVRDVAEVPPPLAIVIDGTLHRLPPAITVNGEAADPDTLLKDRDSVLIQPVATAGEAAAAAGVDLAPAAFRYFVNGTEHIYTRWRSLTVNGQPATPKTPVRQGDTLTLSPVAAPSLREILGIAAQPDDFITVKFNGAACPVAVRRHTITVNGKPAAPDDPAPPGSAIEHSCSESPPTVSDVLLAAEFNPRELPRGSRVDILLNGRPAELTAPVRSGDAVEVLVADR